MQIRCLVVRVHHGQNLASYFQVYDPIQGGLLLIYVHFERWTLL